MDEIIPVSILVVGNPKTESAPLLQAASLPHYETKIHSANGLKEAIKILLERKIDLVLVDSKLDDGDAVQFLEALSHLSPRVIPTIVLAQEYEEKLGFESFRKGAKDFILKDKHRHYLQRLPHVIEKVLKEETRYRENTRVKKNAEVILSTISDGVIGFDLTGKITFANPVAAMYLSQNFELMIGRSIFDILEHMEIDFMPSLRYAMEQVESTNHTAVVGQYSISLGHNKFPFLVKVNLTPIFTELMHLEGYILFFRDIAETKFPTGKMHHMMVQDDLTGLLNRKAMLHRLEHAISYCNRYQTSCAVLYIDLDGFKAVNDALGHHYGDELLLKVSARIQSVIRDADVLARVGGDEFVVLLTHLNHTNDAGRVSVKINQSLIPAFDLNNHSYYISASIGIALYPNDSSDPEKLVQCADVAMGIAKKRGKNNYQYYKSDLNIEAEKNMRISNDLRLAIQADQLELYFHPLLVAKTELVSGLEALLRWHHPEFGMIPPAVFIPLAEEGGLISILGQWVLGKACEYFVLWKKEGLENFDISINLSVKELQRDDFVDNVIECFANHQVDPKRFIFEITESIFAHDPEEIIKKLHQLKQLGCKIAMDDFGTGYSSLSYLRNLPVDIIKIDRSFVQTIGVERNERHEEVVSVIIELAKRLNIRTMAEGIETQEQAEFLKKLGCEYLQGFLFLKPAPYKEITAYLKEKISKGK